MATYETNKLDKFNSDLNTMIIDVAIMKNDINKIQEDLRELKDNHTDNLNRIKEDTKASIDEAKKLITQVKTDLDPVYKKLDKWNDYIIYALFGIVGTGVLTIFEFALSYIQKKIP